MLPGSVVPRSLHVVTEIHPRVDELINVIEEAFPVAASIARTQASKGRGETFGTVEFAESEPETEDATDDLSSWEQLDVVRDVVQEHVFEPAAAELLLYQQGRELGVEVIIAGAGPDGFDWVAAEPASDATENYTQFLETFHDYAQALHAFLRDGGPDPDNTPTPGSTLLPSGG